MAHLAFLTAHVLAAFLALGTGLATLRGGRWLGTHRVSVLVMSLALPGSIAAGWADSPGATRVVFPGLFLLSLAMVVRTELAARRPPGSPAFIDHVGFTLISLVAGFLTVLVLRLGAGPAGAVAAAVAVPLLGRRLLARVQADAAAVPAT